MAGTITHEWNGTTLIITSDSGTSSMDLKGDTGPRGAQGPAGIGINGINGKDGEDGVAGADGNVTFDELTEAQKESLKGDKGDNYVITENDYNQIASIVLNQLVDGEEMLF